ncbi:lipopolysaccharide biosynthesis protein [Dyadobacter arcticus]|uniref:O-antigen/teichoic acid export membrane protein n=1 Tax=Dyadobacter arcticus TaxID=1078754 RepID=A0ABX0UPS1_9BACT|nr:lipopolysaccharide biosynthesis protein [Dyadobacter arcticus]NIJ54979.1 O-antigen/teichoic acid export membrane protein [Dyadobacter arcticus]
MDNAKKLVVNGILWNAIQLIVNQSFTFVIRLVLAKLLFPEQFGIVGMATVFSGFVQVLTDIGIGAALIQKKDENLREEHFHTAFWTGLGWSVLLYVLTSFLVGPLAASFYNQPILTKLIPVISLGILSSPVNLIHKAQLTKRMDFKKMAFIDNVSNIIAGSLSLILAFSGFGIWSLAFNSVASIAIAMPLYFSATKWIPKRIWSYSAFIDVFGFGVYTTGTGVINYLINNIDYLLIGKLLASQALGSYTFAFVLTDTFRGRMIAVINNVMYPMYGKKQSDPESLKKYYLKVVNYNSLFIYPIMVFFVALGSPFIVNIFGDKWQDSVIPLKILSISVMVHMLVNSNTALIRGMGRPGLELKLQLFKAVIYIPILMTSIYYYGIVGAAYAILINKVFAVILAQYTFNNLLNIKISALEFFSAVKTPWIGAIVAFVISSIFHEYFHVHYIVTGTILFVSYVLTIWLIMGKEFKAQFAELKFLKKKL